MTTDLTGDFELDEEEFDWDVFLPDPDDASIAAEAAAIEDEADLDLDDSDFDWETGLQEESESGPGVEGAARAGAAYDRIVDTVRRSVEDPDDDADAAPTAGARTAVALDEEVVVLQPIAPVATEVPADIAGETAGTSAGRDGTIDSESDLDAFDLFEVPPTEPETRTSWNTEAERHTAPVFVAEAETTPDPVVAFESEPDFEADAAIEPAPSVAAASEHEPQAVWEETAWEPDPVESFGPEPEPRDAEAHLAEMAAPVTPRALVDQSPPPASALEAAADVDEDTLHEGTAPELSDESGPAKPPRTKKARDKKEGRSRVFTATVVLACLALAVVAAAAVVHSRHHATAPATTAHTAAPAPPSPDTSRIQAATDAVDSATTSAVVGISSLPNFPTPTNVERVINPFVSSLQLYGNVLSGSNVPAGVRSEVSRAQAQVRHDLTFLDTIDTLPPVQLGTFLQQFDADATQLQATLSTLEQNLKTPAA